jgi:hypothetical protein
MRAPVPQNEINFLDKEYTGLSGPMVDHILEAELANAKQVKIPWADKTLILSYQFWDNLQNPDVEFEHHPDYSTRADFHGHLHDPWFYRRILIPCFLNHAHWILVVLEFLRFSRTKTGPQIFKHTVWHPTVTLYDSIHEDRRDEVWPKIWAYLTERQGLTRKMRQRGAPKYVTNGVSPTQRDMHNCGFYMIENAKNVIWYRDPRASPYHIPKRASYMERKQILASVLEERARWKNNLFPMK